ncbi:hypothetical protein [Hymenobacter terrenus]|uniref:hypothetical protein n=1 Tax=Hymenobacter terrenus TaxID=1629124 RepID=UPI000619E9DC|nr:hypothetical protein [Hymenobacter terrenus]
MLPQTPVVPPVPVPPVEVPVPPAPLGLLARLLALLPELGVAAAVAVLVPTNSRDDPGYQSEWDFIRRNTPPTDKDRAELADLERRHADGTLTKDEEVHLLALLARVKGLRLMKWLIPAKLRLGRNQSAHDFALQIPMAVLHR